MTTHPQAESFFLEYKPKYKIFYELMSKRMRNVLLVSSIYDSFMLEEDGRLSDQIYEEFQNLNLRTLPRITRVSSANEALDLLEENDFDLVITMRRLGDMDAFSFGANVKSIKDIPVILLLNSVVEIKYLPEYEKRKGIDRVFVWNGDSKIFVAIIKHLEDKFNADYDTQHANVRVFIFVDDSIRFYSLLLPELYGEIMRQTHRLLSEGTNDFQDLLKMRIRPKILLAENYEEALSYYERYKDNLMGVISDIEFPVDGKLNKDAGFLFAKKLKEENSNLPIVLQSNKEFYREEAEEMGCFFINKRLHGMMWDLRKWLLDYVGFGDFIFRNQDGEVFGKANDVITFYNKLSEVPVDSLVFHGKNDHFSNWLNARGEFEIAETLKPRKVSEFTKEELKAFLLKTINELVIEKTTGIINDFSRENYHPAILFTRLRPGSLGGKGRGIAFLMFLLNSFMIDTEFKDVVVEIPKTIVIGTDEYDKFMEENNLYKFALSDASDDKVKRKFADAKLSDSIISDLQFLLTDLKGPLAVRSSSLLEDSAYQPFAGIFDTYMIPNNQVDKKDRVKQLCTAIKLVYASQFLKLAKSYAETIQQTVEESKMAVVIQEVVGQEHNKRFYPDFSGTASSYNYYPFGDYMKSEDRIAHIALGLGKTIVEGEASVRFCPRYPKINFFSTPDILLEQSQKYYYGIDLSGGAVNNYVKSLNLSDAIKDECLTKIADSYDFESDTLREGFFGEGSPVITFSQQLKHSIFPLAELVERILKIGERALGSSIEIEFAGNFKKLPDENNVFSILQIRPFLQQEVLLTEDYTSVNMSQILAYSNHVSGNLLRKDIRDIVYVNPETFDKTQTLEMVEEIDSLNSLLTKEDRPYLLIGFGRWGTADRFLGIPVKWSNISGTRAIIETSLEDFTVDFSQGTHFFHNIVTANIGYFYIKHNQENHFIDWDWLKSKIPAHKLKYVNHVTLEEPLIVRIDAKNKEGMIIKQEEKEK